MHVKMMKNENNLQEKELQYSREQFFLNIQVCFECQPRQIKLDSKLDGIKNTK